MGKVIITDEKVVNILEEYNLGLEDVFNFLENLRKSGVVNMFGARPYLQDFFGVSKIEASALLNDWMNNYDEYCEEFNGGKK